MRWGVTLLSTAVLLAVGPAPARADTLPTEPGVEALGTTMSADRLDEQRGGAMVNDIDEHAQLNDNRALNNVTGSNFITDNAFGGAAGLPVAVQNTGNNVVIQNAFIVNLQMQ